MTIDLNPAEQAIQTFKNHFIANLQGCDKSCPKYLWCRFIPQTVTTLNMLRQSRINPKLSAHDQLFGTLNYNRTPLAPLGTKVIIHEKPKQRASWDPPWEGGVAQRTSNESLLTLWSSSRWHRRWTGFRYNWILTNQVQHDEDVLGG